MKKLMLLILVLTTGILSAQGLEKSLKAVEVIPQQTFYLNGGTRASLGGKSRVWYAVTLPPNTVEWYYSFTTQRGQDATKSINLLSQLTRVYDPTGATAIAVQALCAPTGAAACDIYMMDRANADKFMEKVDNWGGTYNYFVSGSRLNFKNGTVQIKDLTSGIIYLGFKNPSGVEGITVTFEVSAIVLEEKAAELTEEQQKKAEMYAELGWKAYERGDIDKCLELSYKALNLNPELGWVNNNIGLVHLIKGNYDDAVEAYSKAIIYFKKTTLADKWFSAAIDDLSKLIKNKNVAGASDILSLLEAEVKH